MLFSTYEIEPLGSLEILNKSLGYEFFISFIETYLLENNNFQFLVYWWLKTLISY